MLPCQHTFCAEPCLSGLLADANGEIKCPECRQKHSIRNKEFPNNFAIQNFIDIYNNNRLKNTPNLNKTKCLI
jgi:hypothetical protein